MKSKELDTLAAGPKPTERVAPPTDGERCPRCHARRARGNSHPCLLCAPHLVPVEYGGTGPSCITAPDPGDEDVARGGLWCDVCGGIVRGRGCDTEITQRFSGRQEHITTHDGECLADAEWMARKLWERAEDAERAAAEDAMADDDEIAAVEDAAGT